MSSAPDAPAASPLATWPPRWTPRAVVFDCDGLLVDTEGRWVELQDDYLARHGVALPPATRRDITGRAIELVVATIAEAVGKDPRRVGEELLVEHRRRETQDLTPLPGALELLRAAARARPVAVASNSPREMLDAKLEALGIADIVDASVAVEDVPAPKPAPDMYLAAAQALGAVPADCLVLEDSETGAQAARAAGAQLIVVPSIPGQEPVGDRRLESLADPELTTWVGSWEDAR